jgi:hypothetical protein
MAQEPATEFVTADNKSAAVNAHNDATTAFSVQLSGPGGLAVNEVEFIPWAGNGVYGATSVPGAVGVSGINLDSNQGVGVSGAGPEAGVSGISNTGVGVQGQSTNNDGVTGVSQSHLKSGVWGHHPGSGIGVSGHSVHGYGVDAYSHHDVGIHAVGGSNAGVFDGNVQVNGTLTATVDIVLSNGDCAEDFDIEESESAEPGTVMVLNRDGALQPSQQAYDKKVAGVISGAGDYRPALILDRKASAERRLPVALVGKVYCKVDAQYAPVEIGDLLTTSPTFGHAMKAEDPTRAFGAVIGKALRPLEAGRAMIPILIALQ